MAIINPNNLKNLADRIEIDITGTPVDTRLLAELTEKQRAYICRLMQEKDGKDKILEILDYGKRKLKSKINSNNKHYYFKN